MLFDTLLAFPDTPISKALLPQMLQGYREFGERVRGAERFALERDAVFMTLNVAESRPTRVSAALGICRLPHARMWVEFVFQDRTDWVRQSEARLNSLAQPKHEAPPPQRLGFYLEQAEGRTILVQPAWVHADGVVSIAHLAFHISLDPEEDRPAVQPGEVAAMLDKAEPGWADTWRDNPAEVEAAVRLGKRIDVTTPSWLVRMWSALARQCGEAELRQFYDMAVYDLRSEWRFIVGLLMVLNSRNIVAIGPTNDLTKLNRARVKAGKPLLMSHREVRLSLSRVQRNRVGSSGPAELQATLVRGHWKLRASGLWWWNPHVRGSGPVGPRRYRVVAGPAGKANA